MNALWMAVNGFTMKSTTKNIIYVGLRMLANVVIGGIAWCLVGRLFLPQIEWLICFMGYQAVFVGFLGGILYLYNHEFA